GDGRSRTMAARIHELRQQRATLAAQANKALETAQTKAKAESRALSAEEIKEQDDFDAKLAALDQDIQLEERKLERERLYGSAASNSGTIVPGSGPQPRTEVGPPNADADPKRGFRTHREFLHSVMVAETRGRIDDRLKPLAVKPQAATGSDEHG